VFILRVIQWLTPVAPLGPAEEALLGPRRAVQMLQGGYESRPKPAAWLADPSEASKPM
jgi:hypothetical protein